MLYIHQYPITTTYAVEYTVFTLPRKHYTSLSPPQVFLPSNHLAVTRTCNFTMSHDKGSSFALAVITWPHSRNKKYCIQQEQQQRKRQSSCYMTYVSESYSPADGCSTYVLFNNTYDLSSFLI